MINKRNIYLLLIFIFLSCNAETDIESDQNATNEINMELVSQTSQSYSQWTKWRGPDGTNISNETEWEIPLREGYFSEAWEIEIGLGYSSFVIKNNRIYTAGYIYEFDKDGNETFSGDAVYCINPENGEIIWQYKYAMLTKTSELTYPGTRSTPYLEDDYLYYAGVDGQIICLKIDDGSLVWHNKTSIEQNYELPEYGFSSSPMIEGDTVYINIGKYGMALNKYDGTVIWTSGPEKTAYSTPVFFTYEDQRYIAAMTYSGLYISELSTGVVKVEYPWEPLLGTNIADPIVIDDKILVSTAYDLGSIMLQFDGVELKEVWKNPDFNNHMSTSIVIDGYVYGNNGFYNDYWGKNTCISWNTGETKWSEKARVCSVTAVGKTLIYLSQLGKLIIVEATPDEYNEFYQKEFTRGYYFTAPVFVDGRLYIRNSVSNIICLEYFQNEDEITSVAQLDE